MLDRKHNFAVEKKLACDACLCPQAWMAVHAPLLRDLACQDAMWSRAVAADSPDPDAAPSQAAQPQGSGQEQFVQEFSAESPARVQSQHCVTRWVLKDGIQWLPILGCLAVRRMTVLCVLVCPNSKGWKEWLLTRLVMCGRTT